MAQLENWYKADWSRRPPGMVWEDWQPWSAWLKSPEAQKYQYAYDVELHVDAGPPGETDPALIKMWKRNNARRIDAVGRAGNELILFEARRNTGWSAIAQVIAYKQLWPLFYPDIKVTGVMLVVETIADEIRASASMQGVPVWVSTEHKTA